MTALRVRFFSVFFLFFMLLAAGLTTQAQTTIAVTSTDDSGPGTLREAITTANGNTALTYLITLPANQTVALTAALPAILFSGTIAGGSTLCPATGTGGSTIARTGSTEFRLLLLSGTNKTMVIENVTFLNGLLGSAGSNIHLYRAGAGILVNYLHDLTVRQCLFSHNSVITIGGSAICTTFGNLVVENSSFTDNGAIAGVVTTDAFTQSVRVNGCTFRQATPSSPPNNMLRLIGVSSGLVQNCTFHYSGTDGLATSSIIYTEAYDVSLPTSITVEHSTFNMPMDNFVYANAFYGNTSAFVRNNVFAQTGPSFLTFNTTGTATITSLGGNVFAKDISASLTLLPSDKNNVSTAGLALGSFTALSGTCVATIPLLPGSAAIDAGVSSTLTTDVRGVARVGAPDAGAFESQGFTLAISSGNNQSALVGRAFANPLRVVVSSPSGDPVDGTVVRFSAPATGASTTFNTGTPAGTTATVASGTAQVTATANATAGGPYTVTASVNGAIPASVEFALTNNSITLTGLAVSPGTATSGNSVTFTATVGNISGIYTFTLTNGVSTTTGARILSAFSQTWAADCAGVQDFTLTVAQSGYSATATTPLTVTAHPDYAAVVDLFNTTNGPGWTNKIGWLQNCNPCRGWNGIVCSGAGRVTQLLLTNRNLVGTIPTSLSTLTNLQRLYLDQNQLTGSIPTSLGSFTALERLATSYNSLTGSIPESLSGLANLHYLDLDNNQLTGSIPASLSVLSRLTRLLLYSNQLSGGIPSELGSLTALQYLYLNDNQLTGSLPASLSALRNLVGLTLNNNQLSGCYPIGYNAFGVSTTTDFSSNTALPDGGSAAGFTAFLNTGTGSDSFVASATASQTTICVGDAVSLSVNGGSTATVSWLAPAGVTLGTPATTSAISATATTSGLKTFTVTVSFGGSCSSTTTVSVSVCALPTLTGFAPSSGTVALASTVTFTATVGNVSDNYAFTLTNGVTRVIGTRPAPTFSQSWIADCGSVQTFTLTVAQSGCSTSATTVLTVAPHPDYAPLMDLYNATNGPGWTNKTNWLEGCSPCRGGVWHGVTCQGGRVVAVSLSNNGLTGTLPASISALTNLQRLYLNNNALTGSIPASLSALTNLTILYLNNNTLSGPIPTGIGSLTNLQTLYLYANALTGPIPTELGSLTALQQLYLNDNQLTGGIPASLGSLTALTQFYLRNNQLSGCYPASLTALCGVSLRDFQNNTGLPGLGSDAAFTAFCNTGAGSDAFVASATASQTALCVGDAVSLSVNGGSTATVNWLVPAGVTLSGPTTTSAISATAITTGMKTFTVTVSFGGSCSSTTTVSISVAALPTATLTANFGGTLTCAQTSLTLTATGGTSYTFAGPGIISQNAMAGTAVVNQTGTYTVAVANSSGCTSNTTTTVSSDTALPTVSIAPNVGPATSATLTCAAPSLTLTTTSSETALRWNTGATSTTLLVNSAGTYSVTATAANGCTVVSNSVVVTSNTAITGFAVAASGSVCAGGSITLTASGCTSGTINWPGGFTGNIFSTSIAGTYTATCTVGTCLTTASGTATVGAAVTATLTANFGGTLTCAQTSLTLTASGGVSYTFAGPGIISQNAMAGTAVVNQTGTYTVAVANSSGCTSNTTVTVVSSTTAPTVSISATSGTLTCAVTSITLTATSSGTGLLWSNAATTPSITVNSAATYSVTATGANGCSAVSNSVTIGSNTAAPTGAMLTASNSGTLTCSVQTLTLTASATGSSLSYVFTGPSGTLVGSGNTRPVSTSGLYSVTITGANGCTTSASTTVFSNTLTPTAGLVASGTITCSVPTATITASGSGTYHFSGPGIVSISGNVATVNVGGTYSVTVLNPANGCFATNTVSVSSDLGGASAAPTLSASSSVVCAGANVQVIASGGSSPMMWYKDGQPTGQTSATLSLGGVQAAQAGSYVLVIAGACSVTSTPFNLTINALPTVTLLVPSNASVQGATITLPLPLNNVNFQVLGGISYERLIVIDRVNGFEIRQVDTNANGVFPVNRTGPFRLTVTGANGCQRTVDGTVVTR